MKIRINKEHVIQIKYDNMKRYTNLLHGVKNKEYIMYYKDKNNNTYIINDREDLEDIMNFIKEVKV